MAMILDAANKASDLLEICKQHKTTGRAAAFAVIFDDSRRTLKLAGVTKSDKSHQEIARVSGSKLTTFYVSGRSPNGDYQAQLLKLFELLNIGSEKIDDPFILFFDLAPEGDEFSQIDLVKLHKDKPCLLLDIVRAIESFTPESEQPSYDMPRHTALDSPQENKRIRILTKEIAYGSMAAITVESVTEVLKTFLM